MSVPKGAISAPSASSRETSDRRVSATPCPVSGRIQRAVAVDEHGAPGSIDLCSPRRFQPAPPLVAVFIVQKRHAFQITGHPKRAIFFKKLWRADRQGAVVYEPDAFQPFIATKTVTHGQIDIVP